MSGLRPVISIKSPYSDINKQIKSKIWQIRKLCPLINTPESHRVTLGFYRSRDAAKLFESPVRGIIS